MVVSPSLPRPVVLVVDDEPLLRMMAIDVVEEAGFEAIEAADADAAIAIFELRPDIRILFTDIQMPGSMDGLKLARAVRDRWPPVRIILTSGHCKAQDLDLGPGHVFFAKPYDVHAVEAALHRFAH
ncbi:response regulator [Novosphingobium sp.]|uniref:response regulator n=1 Tax=Novosphingobium sp. TaxID=1874826 RepID=UPI003D0EFB5D